MKKLLLIFIIVILGVIIFLLHVAVLNNTEKVSLLADKQTTTMEEVEDKIIIQTIPIQEPEYKKGLFSWEEDVFYPENRAPMYAVMNHLEIDEVYQSFEDVDIESDYVENFVSELQLMDIDLYTLVGDRRWTYEADGEKMLEAIDDAVMNREIWGADTLKGIVFDIEPYISNRWRQGEEEALMDNYVKGMEIAYAKAKEHDIRVVLCCPVWYDIKYYDHFVELSNFCDEMSIMNYNRLNEYENIIGEIEYAREMDKSVACIFEFQMVGVHGLTNEKTYNNEGIEAAVDNFEEIYSKAEYSELKFAYHYLAPIQDMLME